MTHIRSRFDEIRTSCGNLLHAVAVISHAFENKLACDYLGLAQSDAKEPAGTIDFWPA